MPSPLMQMENKKWGKWRSDEEFETATSNTVVLLGSVSIGEERILSDEGLGGL